MVCSVTPLGPAGVWLPRRQTVCHPSVLGENWWLSTWRMRALQQMGQRGCKVGYIVIADGPGPFLEGLDTFPCALTCTESPCNGSSTSSCYINECTGWRQHVCFIFRFYNFFFSFLFIFHSQVNELTILYTPPPISFLKSSLFPFEA